MSFAKEGKSKRTVVTLNIFNAIKTLVAGGATSKEISNYLGIGETAITRVRSCESYDEYKQCLAAISVKQREYRAKRFEKELQKKAEEEKAAAAEAVAEAVSEVRHVQEKVEDRTLSNYQTNRLIEEMRKTNEHLKLISNKLAFIVEQLA